MMQQLDIFPRYLISSIHDLNNVASFVHRSAAVNVRVWSPFTVDDVIKNFLNDFEGFKLKTHKRLSRLFKRRECDTSLKETLDFFDVCLTTDEGALHDAFKKHKGLLMEVKNERLEMKTACYNEAKLVVFCLTKAYAESGLLEKHLIEAEKDGKEILFLFLERNLPQKLTNVDFIRMRKTENSSIRLWNYVQWLLVGEGSEYLEEYKYIMLFETIEAILRVKLPIEYTFKHQVCFLYMSINSQIEAFQIDCKNYSIWSKKGIKNRNNQNIEVLEAVSQSKLIVFFLTNEYLKSEHLEREVFYAKKLNKIIIPVLMEKINEGKSRLMNFNQLKVIEAYNGSVSTTRLCSYLQRTFKPSPQSKPIESLHYIKTLGYRYIHLIHLKSKNQLVLVNGLELLSLCPKRKSFVQMPVRLPYFSDEVLIFFCWIEHLSRICAITIKQDAFVVFDEDFKFVEFKSTHAHTLSSCTQLAYSELSRQTYSYALDCDLVGIFNESLNFITEIRLKSAISYLQIINDRIYVIDTSSVISLFDLQINHCYSLDQHTVNKVKSVFSDGVNCDFVYFETSDAVKIFHANSFNYIGEIAKPVLFFSVTVNDYVACDFQFFNGLLVCCNYLYSPVYLFEVEFRMRNNRRVCNTTFVDLNASIDSDFICKANSVQSHVLCDPCLLPCGTIICFQCIHENLNLLTGKFKCSCKMEHELTRGDIVKMNLKTELLSKQILKHSKLVLCKDLDFKIRLNERFDAIEGKMSGRVEALKDEFDKICKSTINEIEKTISMKSKKYALRLRFKSSINKKMSGKIIGSFKNHCLENTG